jgi:hypothetical protein
VTHTHTYPSKHRRPLAAAMHQCYTQSKKGWGWRGGRTPHPPSPHHTTSSTLTPPIRLPVSFSPLFIIVQGGKPSQRRKQQKYEKTTEKKDAVLECTIFTFFYRSVFMCLSGVAALLLQRRHAEGGEKNKTTTKSTLGRCRLLCEKTQRHPPHSSSPLSAPKNVQKEKKIAFYMYLRALACIGEAMK